MTSAATPVTSSAPGVTLTLRDLYYAVFTAAGAYVVAWQAAGSPTNAKALWAVAIGIVPVVFRKVFPNLGEYLDPTSTTATGTTGTSAAPGGAASPPAAAASTPALTTSSPATTAAGSPVPAEFAADPAPPTTAG